MVIVFHNILTGCLEIWGYFYNYFAVMWPTCKWRILAGVEGRTDLTCLMKTVRCPLCMNMKQWSSPQQGDLKALSFLNRGDHLSQSIHFSIHLFLHLIPNHQHKLQATALVPGKQAKFSGPPVTNL